MQLLRRGLVLLLAYLVSAFVASLAVVTLSGLQQGATDWPDQLELILPLVLVLGIGVAWIPLTAALALTLRLWQSRLIATLCAGVVTAFVLLVWQGRLVDSFLSVAISPMDPPLWQQILQDLPSAVVVGLLGGVAFWAIAYRGRPAVLRSPSLS